jgi:hypothetical protein
MKRTVLILLVLMLPFITGCFGVSSYFSTVRSDIMKNVEGDFTRETEFAIGPVLISMAGMFISSEDDPEAKQILSDVSRVQISVHKRMNSDESASNYKVLQRIDRRMNKHGWRYIVKSCSKDEMTVIYVNRNLERGIRKMFIVSLDKNELAMVQLDGNLSRVFETAVKERGLNSIVVAR